MQDDGVSFLSPGGPSGGGELGGRGEVRPEPGFIACPLQQDGDSCPGPAGGFRSTGLMVHTWVSLARGPLGPASAAGTPHTWQIPCACVGRATPTSVQGSHVSVPCVWGPFQKFPEVVTPSGVQGHAHFCRIPWQLGARVALCICRAVGPERAGLGACSSLGSLGGLLLPGPEAVAFMVEGCALA